MSQTLQWENKRHDENINFSHKRLQSLQDELRELSQEKGMSDAKLLELDGLVTQLLSVNESLVAQLTGKPISSFSKSSSSLVKNSKKTKKVIIPKAATMSTIASDANRSMKYNASSYYNNNMSTIPYEIETLKNMHNMYANIAKTIQKTGKKTKGSSSVATSSSTDGVGVNNTKKKNTRLSRKKAQLSDKYNTEQAVTPQQFSYNNNVPSTTNTNHTSSRQSINHNMMDIRIPKPAVSFDNDYELSKLDLSQQQYNTSTNTHHVPHRNNSSSIDNSDYMDYINNRNNYNNSLRSSMSNDDHLSKYPNTTTATTTSNNNNSSQQQQVQDHNEMQNVISSLEEEFDMLNTQYRRLLSNVQSHPNHNNDMNHSNISSNINISKDLPLTTSDTIQRQAEEIVDVIQQLHRKGEQIRALKSSP